MFGSSFGPRGKPRSQRDSHRTAGGYKSGDRRGQRNQRWGVNSEERNDPKKYQATYRGWKRSKGDPSKSSPSHYQRAQSDTRMKIEKERQKRGRGAPHLTFPEERQVDNTWVPRDRAERRKGAPLSPMQWAHEVAVSSSSLQGGPPLTRLKTRIPWRASTGRSALIHPLSGEDFWTQYFGKRAVVFHRGASHYTMMTSSTAAGLMRRYRLGVDADVMGPHIWSQWGGKAPKYGPERGQPAVIALARGKAVRMQLIQLRRPSLLWADPLFFYLARFSPGRGVSMTLHWAPPQETSISMHQDWFHQIVLQVYGARKWTVCSRGLPPKMVAEQLQQEDSGVKEESSEPPPERTGDEPPRKVAVCRDVMLRRGDVLYIPSNTWHWSSPGVKASAHLEFAIQPLVMADLVAALGARSRIKQVPDRIYCTPLHLWRHRNTVDAAYLVSQQCAKAQWLEPPRDVTNFCNEPAVKISLSRLAGTTGRAAGWSQSSDPQERGPLNHHIERARAEKLRRRNQGILGPLSDALTPAGEVLGILAILLLGIWICAAISPEDKGGRARMNAAREARNLRRSQRTKTSAQKKDD